MNRRNPPFTCVLGLFGAALALTAGCTPSQYARQADDVAYKTVSAGQQSALGEKVPFAIDYRPAAPHLLPDPNATDANLPVGILTADEALAIAFSNSREFQTRKEQLFSRALALAESQRGWNGTLVEGVWKADAQHTRQAHDPKTEQNTASGEAPVTWTQRFRQGGALALASTLDFATDFIGQRTTPVGSLLRASFTQPLLRGAWRDLAYEGQYRQERDFLFSVFEYERFTQTFAVGVLNNYYDVLVRRDQLENERQNIRRLEDTVRMTRVLVRNGQTSRIELDQAEQNLINAQVRFEQQLQGYEDSLDTFKVRIGLPIVSQVHVDYPRALRGLADAGPQPIPFEEAKAIEVAESTRPDVLSARAAVRDAVRDVEIAADAFLPNLDLALDIHASGTETQNFWEVKFHRHQRTAGLSFEYDIDQTENRNAYRNALIAAGKAERDYRLFLDEQVRLSVRRSYRSLLQNRRSYELQKKNVELAARRRWLAVIQQRAGKASARDVLEAEEDLRNAQNGLTSALVTYTTTRLSFLADLGMIWVDEKGTIHEREEPFGFDRIARQYPYVGSGGDSSEPQPRR